MTRYFISVVSATTSESWMIKLNVDGVAELVAGSGKAGFATVLIVKPALKLLRLL